jgi:branched-chain amino acid transport system permease protein
MSALAARVGLDRTLGLAAIVFAVVFPVTHINQFWVTDLLPDTFLLGIAAASMIFLAAYGGMVSLGQIGLFGVAGIMLGNFVTTGQVKGLHLGWDPWIGVLAAVAITTALGIVFGAIASRSTGIYFLMLTLTFGVLTYYFFSAVTTFSGFSGISGIQARTPGLIGNPNRHPDRLYYAALIVSVAVYLVLRYVVRTPFGLSLQGIRDDPVRMSSLGFNVALHRTLAFGFAAFIASLSGVLFVWWNDHIDPTSFDLGAVINLLVIGVIGSLYRLEGAWVGALAFVLINDYLQTTTVPVIGGTYNTVIGIVFLAIVLLSPSGLLGIWQWLVGRVLVVGARTSAAAVADAPPGR